MVIAIVFTQHTIIYIDSFHSMLHQVFSADVWVSLLVCLLSVATFAFFSDLLFKKLHLNKIKKTSNKNEIILVTFSMLVQPVSYAEHVKWTSDTKNCSGATLSEQLLDMFFHLGKLLALKFIIFCTFMNWFFKSNLLSNLINRRTEAPVNSNEDVLQRGRAVHIPDAVVFYR